MVAHETEKTPLVLRQLLEHPVGQHLILGGFEGAHRRVCSRQQEIALVKIEIVEPGLERDIEAMGEHFRKIGLRQRAG